MRAGARAMPRCSTAAGQRRMRRAHSGYRTHLGRQARRSPSCERSQPITISPSGTNERRPAQVRMRAADLQRGGCLDMVDGGGNIKLFGHHVVRHGRVGIGRRAEQHAGVGLEIPGLVQAGGHRPVGYRQPPRGGRKVKALRRCGTSPIACAPNSAPIWSAQAPAALTTTDARRVSPSASCTCQ